MRIGQANGHTGADPGSGAVGRFKVGGAVAAYDIAGIDIDRKLGAYFSFSFERGDFVCVIRRTVRAKKPLSRLTLLAIPSGNSRVALSNRMLSRVKSSGMAAAEPEVSFAVDPIKTVAGEEG